MGTIDGGVAKLDRKKSTMIANFRFDPDEWEAGLKAAGLTSVRASRKKAYSDAESDAKSAYKGKLEAIKLGERWKKKFVAAMT